MESLFNIVALMLAFFLCGLAVRDRVKVFGWLRLNDNTCTNGADRKEGLMRKWKLDDLSMELDSLNKGK